MTPVIDDDGLYPEGTRFMIPGLGTFRISRHTKDIDLTGDENFTFGIRKALSEAEYLVCDLDTGDKRFMTHEAVEMLGRDHHVSEVKVVLDDPDDNSTASCTGRPYVPDTRTPAERRRDDRRFRRRRKWQARGWWLRGLLPRGWKDTER